MVLEGQYLERATVIPVGALALEGLYHRGALSPPALILPPLSAGAGSPMELPLVAELAWALTRAGHATLRFNPRGLGASQGRPGDLASLVEDALAALGQLLATVGGARAAVVAVGEGGRAALELSRDARCAGVAFVAPPVSLAPELARLPSQQRVWILVGGAGWPAEEGGSADRRAAAEGPRHPIERIEGADAGFFLSGLAAVGKRAASFVDSLGFS